MRVFPKLILLFVFQVFLLVAVTFSISGELIEPTRTLQSHEKTSGKISVFSEPSNLDVFLDNSKIGKTPIMSMKVGAGTQSLKVENSETKIHVMPGKSLQMSLHKGSFIEIKEKEKPQKLEENATEKKKTDEPTKEKTENEPKYDPLYWPLKPTGPIQ